MSKSKILAELDAMVSARLFGSETVAEYYQVARLTPRELLRCKIKLPDGPNGEMVEVPIKDLGISYPVVITQNRIHDNVTYYPDAVDTDMQGQAGRGAMSRGEERGPRGAATAGDQTPEVKSWKLRRYDFVIQFCWQPKTRTQRHEKPAGGDAAAGTASAPAQNSPAG